MSQATDQTLATLQQLDTDAKALIAQGQAGSQAAVDAFANQVTIQAQATDAAIKAALTPAQAGS